MTIAIFFLLITGVVLNAGAQLCLKAGMNQIGEITLSGYHWHHILPLALKVFLNSFVLTGLGCYVISVLVWLVVLSRVEVSVAYPMLSLGYVANALIAHFWMHESMSVAKSSGIAIILIGVYLIAKG